MTYRPKIKFVLLGKTSVCADAKTCKDTKYYLNLQIYVPKR